MTLNPPCPTLEVFEAKQERNFLCPKLQTKPLAPMLPGSSSGSSSLTTRPPRNRPIRATARSSCSPTASSPLPALSPTEGSSATLIAPRGKLLGCCQNGGILGGRDEV